MITAGNESKDLVLFSSRFDKGRIIEIVNSLPNLAQMSRDVTHQVGSIEKCQKFRSPTVIATIFHREKW